MNEIYIIINYVNNISFYIGYKRLIKCSSMIPVHTDGCVRCALFLKASHNCVEIIKKKKTDLCIDI